MEQTDKNFALKVKFGGKEISLSPTLAKKYSLAGLEAEKYQDAIDILKKLALKDGISPNEFMENLLLDRRNALKNSYLEKLNGDEVLAEKLMQLDNEIKPKAKNKFEKISKIFSEYKTVKDLPDEVVLISELNNISLFDALLRYKFSELKKAENEELNRQKNYKSSVGSLKTNNVDYGYSYINALLKGINN